MSDKNTKGRWFVLICKTENVVVEPITTSRLFYYVKIDSQMTVFCVENMENMENEKAKYSSCILGVNVVQYHNGSEVE